MALGKHPSYHCAYRCWTPMIRRPYAKAHCIGHRWTKALLYSIRRSSYEPEIPTQFRKWVTGENGSPFCVQFVIIFGNPNFQNTLERQQQRPHPCVESIQHWQTNWTIIHSRCVCIGRQSFEIGIYIFRGWGTFRNFRLNFLYCIAHAIFAPLQSEIRCTN